MPGVFNRQRHFPFSSTRFNPVPLLESASVLSLNMFTSLHDARSASPNEQHASQRRKHFVLSVRCGHTQSATVGKRASSLSVPLTADECSGWLARWRRRQTVFECCGRPRMSLDESAMLISCSNTSHDAITCGRHLRMLFNLRRKAQHVLKVVVVLGRLTPRLQT